MTLKILKNHIFGLKMSSFAIFYGVVSGLPGALYSICCLGVSIILESEKIVTMWPTNDLIALTRKGRRGVGAQPPLFNKQNVEI